MVSRIMSSFLTAAVVALFIFVPAFAFAGNAADAMNKLKEQADVKAESSSVSAKADEASANAGMKEKAKKAGKELLEKGKKSGK